MVLLSCSGVERESSWRESELMVSLSSSSTGAKRSVDTAVECVAEGSGLVLCRPRCAMAMYTSDQLVGIIFGKLLVYYYRE
jgi:hypothetical protein